MTDLLLWTDIETTGLNEVEDTLLEVGMRVTDWTGSNVARTVQPSDTPILLAGFTQGVDRLRVEPAQQKRFDRTNRRPIQTGTNQQGHARLGTPHTGSLAARTRIHQRRHRHGRRREPHARRQQRPLRQKMAQPKIQPHTVRPHAPSNHGREQHPRTRPPYEPGTVLQRTQENHRPSRPTLLGRFDTNVRLLSESRNGSKEQP